MHYISVSLSSFRTRIFAVSHRRYIPVVTAARYSFILVDPRVHRRLGHRETSYVIITHELWIDQWYPIVQCLVSNPPSRSSVKTRVDGYPHQDSASFLRSMTQWAHLRWDSFQEDMKNYSRKTNSGQLLLLLYSVQ